MTNRVKKGFGMVSTTVMRNPELSLGEKALYAYLSTYASSSNDELFVAINKMASECNIGVSTVKRYLATLEKKNIISRVSRGHKVSKITILLK
jgi:DNA-binding MarR family transcriptional regulator